MRIIEFRAENFMRLSVVQITPQGNVIQITGANGEGKSSTIGAIWAAIGGKDAVPDDPIHKGKERARVELKLGEGSDVQLIVERTFTKSAAGGSLTLKGPDGGKFSKPQQMLDGLMGAIGFDPLQFMRMDAKQQFAMLRGIVKIDIDIDALDRRRATTFEERTGINRDLVSAKARAAAIVVPDDLPDQEPDRAALLNTMTTAARHNDAVAEEHRRRATAQGNLKTARAEVKDLEAQLAEARQVATDCEAKVSDLDAEAVPEPIDLDAVRAQLQAAEQAADGFRKRQAKIDADAQVTTLERSSEEKTTAIKTIDDQKTNALKSAKMPVEGLEFLVPEGESFSAGTVSYKGHPLRQASGAEQLAVSAAIGAALNPKLRVLLCRDGSLLDSKSLAALAEFAKQHDLQIFLEKVDESGEVGVVIEDGHVRGQEALVEQFLKEETEGAKKGEKEPAKSDPPDEQRTAKATAYVEAEIAKLDDCRYPADCDKANATVKHMMKAFPEMFAAKWTPAYLERVKMLTKKK